MPDRRPSERPPTDRPMPDRPLADGPLTERPTRGRSMPDGSKAHPSDAGTRGEAADDRSALACPVCGEHRLAIIDFPETTATGYQALSEIIGMGEPTVVTPPAIGCLACGAEWPNVDAFQAAEGGTAPGDHR
jgi:hypothetical protein